MNHGEIEDSQIDQAAKLLVYRRVIFIHGRSGIGKTTYAKLVAQAVAEKDLLKVYIATGDGYAQHSRYHPFDKPWSQPGLKDMASTATKAAGTAAALFDPIGRLVAPVIKIASTAWRSNRSNTRNYTREEVEGCGVFAVRSNKQRIFIFDNFHFWDKRSLEFAEKVIGSREHLALYIIVVSTDYDQIESIHPYRDVLKCLPKGVDAKYTGLSPIFLKAEFLPGVTDARADTILAHANGSIPIIKKLYDLSSTISNENDARELLSKAALDFKIENLSNLSGNNDQHRALSCLSVLGANATVREVACSMDLDDSEAIKILRWGKEHDLINILDDNQIVFVHDVYRALFDSKRQLGSAFLDKINICCALAIPDDYEKRLAIASRGEDSDLITTLVISYLRNHILRWKDGSFDLSAELDSVRNLLGSKYSSKLNDIESVFHTINESATNRQYADAAWKASFTHVCAHPNASVEQSIIFAHYAYLSRDNGLRKEAISMLTNSRTLGTREAERSFTTSSMLAYGLSLDNKLSESTTVLTEEEAYLSQQLERFKNAQFYIAILERMSLICFENKIATGRLQRSYRYFEWFFSEYGFLKRPEEFLKCASNLCSALTIGGNAREATVLANSAKNVMDTVDLNWSMAPSFLVNNEMVSLIHSHEGDFEKYADVWMGLSRKNSHARIPFLVNTLGCFIETGSMKLGAVDIKEISNKLESELDNSSDTEAFMLYIAHYSLWQAGICVSEFLTCANHKAEADRRVAEIPYVNGDLFRIRHKFLDESLGTISAIKATDWSELAFNSETASELPHFYRRAVHFNPLEHWLPQ